jgi:excisionase family DNA binding protein
MLHELLGRLGQAVHTSDEFLSVVEAAKIAHVGESTIRGWIKTGALRAGKAGRLVRVRRSDLDRLITESRPAKRPDPEHEAAKILERNRPTER